MNGFGSTGMMISGVAGVIGATDAGGMTTDDEAPVSLPVLFVGVTTSFTVFIISPPLGSELGTEVVALVSAAPEVVMGVAVAEAVYVPKRRYEEFAISKSASSASGERS